jgi:hypothetical protein
LTVLHLVRRWTQWRLQTAQPTGHSGTRRQKFCYLTPRPDQICLDSSREQADTAAAVSWDAICQNFSNNSASWQVDLVNLVLFSAFLCVNFGTAV